MNNLENFVKNFFEQISLCVCLEDENTEQDLTQIEMNDIDMNNDDDIDINKNNIIDKPIDDTTDIENEWTDLGE